MTSFSSGALERIDHTGTIRSRARRHRAVNLPRMLRVASPLVLLGVWQLVSGTGVVSQEKLPSLSSIWFAGVEVARNGELGAGIEVSLRRMLIGFVIGAVIGAALGVIAGLITLADSMVDPIMHMIRNVPLFGLIPVFILWFGIGELPKVLLITLAAALPVYVNVHAGMRETDPRLVEVSSVLGYSRWQRLSHVILPSAVPHTLVGVRIGVASAWLSLVVAEQINANAGIGFMIENARDFLRIDIVFVGLLLYAFIGLLMDSLVRLVQRRLLRWRVR